VPWRQIFETFGEIGDDVSSDILSEVPMRVGGVKAFQRQNKH
jgi:hypothetical protein